MAHFYKLLFIAVASICSSAVFAQVQEYPNRPVRILVGSAPGGSVDLVCRLIAQKLSQSLGQPFIIETRPGAGGTLAPALVTKAAPDGYTLLAGETASVSIAPYVIKNLPYNITSDFAPVSMTVNTPMVLVSGTKNNPEIKTFADLVKEARAHPGKIDYGASGVGSSQHIGMEAIKAGMKIHMTHIPYKGGPFTLAALLAGEIGVTFTSISTINSMRGSINVLAVSGKDRFPLFPDVPSLSEFISGYDFSSQQGILAPAGTPPQIISRLSDAIRDALYSADVQDRLKEMGFITTWRPPEGYAENLKQELVKYAQAVKQANIQPE